MRLNAAKAWSVWEGSTLSLLQDPERMRNFGADAYAIAFARIECHYFVNAGFFASDGQLLTDAVRLRDIPGTIIHGRYDVVTPVKNAWDLKAAWPTRRAAHRRRRRPRHERARHHPRARIGNSPLSQRPRRRLAAASVPR